MQRLFPDNPTVPLPPLAERMRPKRLQDVVGQEAVLSILRSALVAKRLPSMILWGPPGSGKTTIARLLAQEGEYQFVALSAVTATVKEVRALVDRARQQQRMGKATLLFVDELHRFNKAQQDALLPAVEQGIVTFVGATTENPSFSVIPALRSRCAIYQLQPLSLEHIQRIVERAIEQDAQLQQYRWVIEDWESIYRYSSGDARRALNLLELALAAVAPDGKGSKQTIRLSGAFLQQVLQKNLPHYDREGEEHYNTISAFIKSLRGSDPDAALLWLAKMVEAGEDPVFIARRLIIFASEDVGNADPMALVLATATLQAVQNIGMPEARIVLAQATAYLASAPKSNAAYQAIDQALAFVQAHPNLVVPLHLRNAPTALMKQAGYGVGYRYPHHEPGHFIAEQRYFPEDVPEQRFYEPTTNGAEQQIRERLQQWWPQRHRSSPDGEE